MIGMQKLMNKHFCFKEWIKGLKRYWVGLFVIGVLASICFPLQGQAVVQPSDSFYVTDQGHVLNNQTKDHILTVNQAFEKTKEKPQIAVVVVNSLEGEMIENYTVKQFEAMEIGNKAYDNGVLILLALQDREIRIEVGYGLEGILPDGKVGRIIDASMGDLASGNYSQAMTNIFNQLVLAIQEEYGYQDIFDGQVTAIDAPTLVNPLFMAGGALVILIVYVFICRILGISSIDTLFLLLHLFSGFSSGSSSSSSRGGGGRSGGGGASRNF